MTNRRRWKPDPHVFVNFVAENGKIEHLKFKSDGGGDWHSVITDAAGDIGRQVDKVLDVVNKVGTSGDAQSAMSSAIWKIMEDYKAASAK